MQNCFYSFVYKFKLCLWGVKFYWNSGVLFNFEAKLLLSNPLLMSQTWWGLHVSLNLYTWQRLNVLISILLTIFMVCTFLKRSWILPLVLKVVEFGIGSWKVLDFFIRSWKVLKINNIVYALQLFSVKFRSAIKNQKLCDIFRVDRAIR